AHQGPGRFWRRRGSAPGQRVGDRAIGGRGEPGVLRGDGGVGAREALLRPHSRSYLPRHGARQQAPADRRARVRGGRGAHGGGPSRARHRDGDAADRGGRPAGDGGGGLFRGGHDPGEPGRRFGDPGGGPATPRRRLLPEPLPGRPGGRGHGPARELPLPGEPEAHRRAGGRPRPRRALGPARGDRRRPKVRRPRTRPAGPPARPGDGRSGQGPERGPRGRPGDGQALPHPSPLAPTPGPLRERRLPHRARRHKHPRPRPRRGQRHPPRRRRTGPVARGRPRPLAVRQGPGRLPGRVRRPGRGPPPRPRRGPPGDGGTRRAPRARHKRPRRPGPLRRRGPPAQHRHGPGLGPRSARKRRRPRLGDRV
ncbi:MAG: FIG028593: membrane protein, partial [uncultured Rubrobacteraceae bacterium]